MTVLGTPPGGIFVVVVVVSIDGFVWRRVVEPVWDSGGRVVSTVMVVVCWGWYRIGLVSSAVSSSCAPGVVV